MSSLATASQPACQGAPVIDMSTPVSVRLPRDPRCGALARRAIEDHAGKAVGPTALLDAKTVAVELVNNAYLHGEGEIELRMAVLGDRIRIEVRDEGRDATIRVRHQPGRGWGGNGLRIVDAIAMRWGTEKPQAHVWAEVSV